MAPLSDATALILPVPAADPLVGPWRARYDRSAREGVPAHLTLLYPFLPPDEVGVEELDHLAEIATSLAPFSLRFSRVEALGDILVLEPEPYAAVERAREAVLQRWPGLVPYGGKYGPRPRLHLTVAWSAPARPDGAEDFSPVIAAIRPELPLSCEVGALWLMERREGLWAPRVVYGLGAGISPPSP